MDGCGEARAGASAQVFGNPVNHECCYAAPITDFGRRCYMNRLQREFVSAAGVFLLLFAITTAWAQKASQQPERLAQDASLEATMTFIQVKLNSIGAVKYVARAHDSENGGDWANSFKDEVSRLIANPSVCRVYYHWFTSVQDRVTMDKDVGFALYDVKKIRVLTREELFKTDNAAMGRDWTAKVEPPVYVVVVERPAHVENHFVFLDEEFAKQIARALSHAVGLCGGKIDQ